MTNQDSMWREECALAAYLIHRVCDRAKGCTEEECLRNYPRDRYFIGNLRPGQEAEKVPLPNEEPVDKEEVEDDDQPWSFMRELRQKLAPVAFGVDFQISCVAKEVKIQVALHWNCYYRVFPSRQEQIQYQMWIQGSREEATASSQEQETDQFESSNGPNNLSAEVLSRRRGRVPTEDLCPKFRKITCVATGEIILRALANGDWQIDAASLAEAVEGECRKASDIARNAEDALRVASNPDERIGIPEEALQNEEAYARFLRTLATPIAQAWMWDIETSIRPGYQKDNWIVSIRFANRSSIDANARNQEGFFFDTKASFKISGASLVPFELSVIPQGFRYDRTILARGFNCAVECQRVDSNMFSTTHVPIYNQKRYATRSTPSAPFEQLARDPLPILRGVLDSMREYESVWQEERQRYTDNDPRWEALYGDEYDKDHQTFNEEIRRFSDGVWLIERDPDIFKAFCLTNQTFSMGEKTHWRLFQLVFLVSQIPSIAALNPAYDEFSSEREFVDIIYFPTGGGKTEAYLAVTVFHLFYDRLRGKPAGVTTWIRFPLRLLTLQQTQRAADVIGLAELVRMQQDDPRLNGPGVDGFSVGYFVGEGGSPNKIVRPHPVYATPEDQLVWSQVNDPEARQQWKRVVRCPACKTQSITVDFRVDDMRLLHKCTNPDCRFPEGILPVYVVDNEIYRYLPSVILGTIDKLAALGHQRKLSMIFGAVDGKCPKHGYFKGVCCQSGCDCRNQWQDSVPAGISGVTLFIQDELHLLKEGLGTFDSHYETFAQRLRREYGHNEPLKIIASSATIEAFERQVEHLYGRNARLARRFPGLGPKADSSFYAETLDHPQRIFVGIMPHNKTILNAVLELIEYYHREVLTLERVTSNANPYGGDIGPNSKDYAEILDNYRTSLTYFIAKPQLDQIHADIEGDVNGNMAKDGFPSLNIRELTSNTTTGDVARILDHLEQRATSSEESPDCVLATSMISHGVDIDRLNMMLFYGMPRLNAEYIQASSRVGRRHVGIVFDCFAPIRERDQSHYAYFEKFHEFLGQLVEPAAINRWSRFSIQRTLPGLFLGVLLQVLANRQEDESPNTFYDLRKVVQKITSREIGPDDFVPFLKDAYQVVRDSDSGSVSFADEIDRLVHVFLYDELSTPGSTGRSLFNALDPPPMRSLRDIDEPVPIVLDFNGSQWATIRSRSQVR